ncbi:hypothetical protein ON010_g2617 [Phytophthora cinnamomi]|nr:hypothetical protein ON010_g2617 [Phytophthora cinnamomi]
MMLTNFARIGRRPFEDPSSDLDIDLSCTSRSSVGSGQLHLGQEYDTPRYILRRASDIWHVYQEEAGPDRLHQDALDVGNVEAGQDQVGDKDWEIVRRREDDAGMQRVTPQTLTTHPKYPLHLPAVRGSPNASVAQVRLQ